MTSRRRDGTADPGRLSTPTTTSTPNVDGPVMTALHPAGRIPESEGPAQHDVEVVRGWDRPAGSLALSVMSLRGGVGATRLCECLGVHVGHPSDRQVVAREVPITWGRPMAVTQDGSVRVLVVKGTTVGAMDAASIRAVNTGGVVVVAIEDGITGPRIPRAARRYLRSISGLAPVVIVPFHRPWRYDPRAPMGGRYRKALNRIITAALEVERAAPTREPYQS